MAYAVVCMMCVLRSVGRDVCSVSCIVLCCVVLCGDVLCCVLYDG